MIALGQSSSTQLHTPSHGTLNLLVGSQYGIVVESDSQLSYGGHPVGEGQKLFKLDDRTVCVIAGFYRDPGPEHLGSSKAFPLLTSIPNIFQAYYKNAERRPYETFKDKVSSLGESLVFNLELIAMVDQASGLQQQPETSILTIAGYENGSLKVAQIHANPIKTNQGIIYQEEVSPIQTLGKSLSTFSAGLDVVAADMLHNPASTRALSHAEMQDYYDALGAKDVGQTPLSLLEDAEDSVETETARFFPGVVGGRKEVAVLSGGMVTKFLSLPSDTIAMRNVSIMMDGQYIGPLRFPRVSQVAASSPSSIVINVNLYENWVRQDLDNQIFDRSIFIGVAFDYLGSGLAFISPTNLFVDCAIYLGPRVKPDDPFVLQLKSTFPSLDIVPWGEIRMVNLDEF